MADTTERVYNFHLKSVSAMLQHLDDIDSSDKLKEWRMHPDNKNQSVAGDDRSPPWTWQTYLYHDGEHITISSDVLMACLRAAGASILLKGKTTFKSLTQSGITVLEEHFPLIVNGKLVPVSEIEKITGNFHEQREAVKPLGFRLFTKRVAVRSTKHVRVRPRFDNWEVKGQVVVIAEEITTELLQQLFTIAGRFKGFCDWRPSAKQSPGPFGRFSATVTPAKMPASKAS